jgi:hypothetical protein
MSNDREYAREHLDIVLFILRGVVELLLNFKNKYKKTEKVSNTPLFFVEKISNAPVSRVISYDPARSYASSLPTRFPLTRSPLVARLLAACHTGSRRSRGPSATCSREDLVPSPEYNTHLAN